MPDQGKGQRFEGLLTAEATRAVLQAFLLSRTLILLATVLMAAVQHDAPLQMWNRLDSIWYQGIAQFGYHWTLDGKSALAFFPLLPLLLHGALLLGIPGTLAGIIISNLAFVGALYYLYALAAPRYGNPSATRAVLLLAVFPTAFFTFAPYTEALFLLSALGVWYHARRQQWWLTGIYLAVALLTRSTSFALIPPLVLILLQAKAHDHSREAVRGCTRAGVQVFSPAMLGWLTYLCYLRLHRIAPSALLHAQRGWHRALTWPWVGFTSSASWLWHHGTENAGWTTENVLQMSVAIIFLGLTTVAWRELDLPARVYCLGFWVLALASPEYLDDYLAPLSSIDRFVLALFPLTIWAGNHITGRLWRPVMIVFSLLLAGSTAVHIGGGWVG